LRDIVEYYSKYVKDLPLLLAFLALVYCLTVKYFAHKIFKFYFFALKFTRTSKSFAYLPRKVLAQAFFIALAHFRKAETQSRTIIKWAGKNTPREIIGNCGFNKTMFMQAANV